MTFGKDYFFDELSIRNIKYKFKIIDTGGVLNQRKISSKTIKVADGIVLVYSFDYKNSLQTANYWLKQIEQSGDIENKAIILIGNKIDVQKRQVSSEEGRKFAEENYLKYYETSAMTGLNIKTAFNELYKDIYNLFLESLTKDEKIRLTEAENINVIDKGDYIILENEKKEKIEERNYKIILDKYYKY